MRRVGGADVGGWMGIRTARYGRAVGARWFLAVYCPVMSCPVLSCPGSGDVFVVPAEAGLTLPQLLLDENAKHRAQL